MNYEGHPARFFGRNKLRRLGLFGIRLAIISVLMSAWLGSRTIALVSLTVGLAAVTIWIIGLPTQEESLGG